MEPSQSTNGAAAPVTALNYTPLPSPLETVLPHEQQAAEMIVYENFKTACGKYPPHVAGYNILIRVYQRDPTKKMMGPDGKEIDFITKTDKAVTADKYQSVVGVVVGMGPQAYRGTNFDGTPRYPEGVWCMIGDIVVIPRYDGQQFSYGDPKLGMHRMIPLVSINDDKIICKLQDPEDVIATHVIDVERS